MIIAEYLSRLTRAIERCSKDEWCRAVGIIDAAWRSERQIIVFGNGGSALTAMHAITDWNKTLYLTSGRRFRGVCLNENPGLFSAYANDMSYEDVFVRQLEAIVRERDVIVAVSGSGNSENVVRAVQLARDAGATTICVTGFDGGRISGLADCNVNIPVDDMQISEDLHLVFVHVVLRELMARSAGEATALTEPAATRACVEERPDSA